MSADADLEAIEETADELPETGVRSTSQFSRSIHKQDDDADEPLPACREKHRDTDFETCHPPSMVGFNRWKLCDYPECYGTKVATDGGLERYIRFNSKHVRRILTGKKTLTVRLEFERDLHVDDRVDLLDEDGERFATATIASVGEMTALKFVDLDPDGHRSYKSVAEFAAHLREYYPDADFWPGSRVYIFRFRNVQPDPHYAPHDPRPQAEPEEVNTGP